MARVELAGIGLDDAVKSEVRVLDGAARRWQRHARVVRRRPRHDRRAVVADRHRRARVAHRSVPPFEGEQTVIDNHVDIGVDVGTTRSPVLVFDARPSWGSTFVRRALEDDPRFAVGYRARLAPALLAGTANGRLDARRSTASTVVIGGADALTASDVALLEQFVRVRGGTLGPAA